MLRARTLIPTTRMKNLGCGRRNRAKLAEPSAKGIDFESTILSGRSSCAGKRKAIGHLIWRHENQSSGETKRRRGTASASFRAHSSGAAGRRLARRVSGRGYDALARSRIEPDWIAGISIGGINAAIIAAERFSLPGRFRYGCGLRPHRPIISLSRWSTTLRLFTTNAA
jgi:hypothetical protein